MLQEPYPELDDLLEMMGEAGLHLADIADAARPTPRIETCHGVRVGLARVQVADGDGEELDRAQRDRFIAAEQRRHRVLILLRTGAQCRRDRW